VASASILNVAAYVLPFAPRLLSSARKAPTAKVSRAEAPRGSLEIQTEYNNEGFALNFSRSEIDSARWLAEEGHTVILREAPKKGGVRGKNTSDLLVNGVPEDVFTPKTENPRNIAQSVAKKGSQTSRVTVDLSNTTITREQLGGVSGLLRDVHQQIGLPGNAITDVRIIDTRVLSFIDALRKLNSENPKIP
jgi:hypothetical protein